MSRLRLFPVSLFLFSSLCIASEQVDQYSQLANLTKFHEMTLAGAKLAMFFDPRLKSAEASLACLESTGPDMLKRAHVESLRKFLTNDELSDSLSFLTSDLGRRYLLKDRNEVGKYLRVSSYGPTEQITKEEERQVEKFKNSSGGLKITLVHADMAASMALASNEVLDICLGKN